MRSPLVVVLTLAPLHAVPQDGKPVSVESTTSAKASTAKTSRPLTQRVDRLTWADTKYLRREVRANSSTTSSQHSAGVSFGADGALMVTWQSRRQRNGMTGVYFQRFDSAGRRVGGEASMHTAFDRVQGAPAGLAGAQPWFAWESFDPRKEGGVIRLARADARHPIRVGSGQAASVALAAGKDGGVLVAFVDLDERGRPSVWQQSFDKDGQPVRAARCLAPKELGDLPVLARTEDGGHVIAWAARDLEGHPAGVRFQRFDAAGETVGKVVSLPGHEAKGAIEPAIAALPTGGFVLAWHVRSKRAENYDVMARRFSADGLAAGPSILVAKGETRLSGACVAASAHAGGRFCVAWTRGEGDAVNQDVVARLFDLDGAALGTPLQVTKQGAGDQSLTAASGVARIAFGPQGALAFAWSGDGGLGDKSAAHLTLMLPVGHPKFAAAGETRTEHLVALEEIPTTTETAARVGKPHDPPVFIKHYPQNRGNYNRESAGDPGFVAITNTGWTPPDPRIAVGPNHIVEMVNGGIAFFKKDGTRTFFQNIVNASGF